MKKIYLLEHIHVTWAVPNVRCEDCKLIGIFSNKNYVNQIIQHYSNDVIGFSSAPEGFSITEMLVKEKLFMQDGNYFLVIRYQETSIMRM